MTLSALFGSDGIITKSMEAVNLAEIEQEKESISMAIISLKINNKEINQKNLGEELKKQSGHTATSVEDIGDGSLLVFFPCKRVYEVEKNGDIKYIGKEDEINTVIVTADKESDLDSKQIQAVTINVKKYNANEDENISIQYAWNQSKKDEPNKYTTTKLEEGTNIALIDSGEQSTGNYYLWLKVKVGNTDEIKRTYGEYYIQEYTTLLSTSKENSAESGFLGNTDIQRGNIRSVTFTNSINGPTDEGVTYWNPSNKDSEVIRAWYTTEEIDGVNYYDVTIGQEGKVIANAYSNRLFANIGTNVTGEVTIKGLKNLDTSNVINMQEMFYNCEGLTSLEVSDFDTNNVKSMYSMFANCKGLTNIDVNNFDTSSVISMRGIFFGCEGLTSLDVSNFKTSSVTNMRNMFANCKGLTSLDLSNFNTSSVTDMLGMFGNCEELESLNVSNFNTSNVTTMYQMFYNCKSLTSLDVSNFDTSNVRDMYAMFRDCEKLENLDVKNFKTSKVTTMKRMFQNCKQLTSLDVSSFDTGNVTDMEAMFAQCVGLTDLDLSNFNTSSVTTMYQMFYHCDGLTSLDLRNWVVEITSSYIFSYIPTNCKISVSTQSMKDWVLNRHSALINVHVVDKNGNIIE